jgi:hypothetical protein
MIFQRFYVVSDPFLTTTSALLSDALISRVRAILRSVGESSGCPAPDDGKLRSDTPEDQEQDSCSDTPEEQERSFCSETPEKKERNSCSDTPEKQERSSCSDTPEEQERGSCSDTPEEESRNARSWLVALALGNNAPAESQDAERTADRIRGMARRLQAMVLTRISECNINNINGAYYDTRKFKLCTVDLPRSFSCSFQSIKKEKN